MLRNFSKSLSISDPPNGGDDSAQDHVRTCDQGNTSQSKGVLSSSSINPLSQSQPPAPPPPPAPSLPLPPSRVKAIPPGQNGCHPYERLIEFSTDPHRGFFYSANFMQGAGMVILQPSTSRIVVVWEKKAQYWFLPKGRKDIGESLEEAAVREAYEESGYRATLMPLWQETHAPAPLDSIHYLDWCPTTEPIAMELSPWRSRRVPNMPNVRVNGNYFISWYVGEIPADAERELNTGMPDEINYEPHLLTIEQARVALKGSRHLHVVELAWSIYRRTDDINQQLQKQERQWATQETLTSEEPDQSTAELATPDSTLISQMGV